MSVITYTCHGPFVCTCGHTRTCIFSCTYSETCKHSRNQATPSEISSRLFPSLQPATGNFLFSLSTPRSPGPGSAIWARPGAQFAVPAGWSSDHWVMGVEQYLNHFMSDIQDNTSNCSTVAYKGTQTNVDSYCFCY